MRRSLLLTIACLAAGQAAWLAAGAGRGTVVVAETRLSTLPYELDGWIGREARFDDDVYEVLNADETLLRLYLKEGRRPVWVYIGYYGTEKGGRTGHMPQHCYPGAGWQIEEMGKEKIGGPSSEPVTVNKILVRRKEERIATLWWMQAGTTVMNSGWSMNLNRFRRRILSNRDDGAFVRLSSGSRGDPEEALSSQKELAAVLLKQLPSYWPVEVERREDVTREG